VLAICQVASVETFKHALEKIARHYHLTQRSVGKLFIF